VFVKIEHVQIAATARAQGCRAIPKGFGLGQTVGKSIHVPTVSIKTADFIEEIQVQPRVRQPS